MLKKLSLLVEERLMALANFLQVIIKAILCSFSFISASYSKLGFASAKNLRAKKTFLEKFVLFFYLKN